MFSSTVVNDVTSDFSWGWTDVALPTTVTQDPVVLLEYFLTALFGVLQTPDIAHGAVAVSNCFVVHTCEWSTEYVSPRWC